MTAVIKSVYLTLTGGSRANLSQLSWKSLLGVEQRRRKEKRKEEEIDATLAGQLSDERGVTRSRGISRKRGKFGCLDETKRAKKLPRPPKVPTKPLYLANTQPRPRLMLNLAPRYRYYCRLVNLRSRPGSGCCCCARSCEPKATTTTFS